MERVAVIRDPEQVSGSGQIGAIQSAVVALRVQLVPIGMRDPLFAWILIFFIVRDRKTHCDAI